MRNYIIIFTLLFSLLGNAFFVFQGYRQVKEMQKEAQILEQQKQYFAENIFGEDFALKDYSATKFSLDQEGKDIIKNAREFHSSPAIIKGEAYDEAVCAGYVFALSEIFWDKTAPYQIGMMEQNTKTPADACQLPYSFEYVGGKILADFSAKFSLIEKDYWQKINSEELQQFFYAAFTEEALLGEIGFFYTDTDFVFDLDMYDSYNSHIAKNIGISVFEKNIGNKEEKTHRDIIQRVFNTSDEIFDKSEILFSYYYWELFGKQIVWKDENFYYLGEDDALGEKVIFKDFDILKYRDVTLMHFYEGAQVDSLLELTLAGDFYPINILQINPRMIEKM